METGIFLSTKTLLIAAIVIALVAGAVTLIILKQRIKRKQSIPAQGMVQPGESHPRPQPYVPPEPVPQPARRCENCGQPAEDGDVFCLKCGSKL